MSLSPLKARGPDLCEIVLANQERSSFKARQFCAKGTAKEETWLRIISSQGLGTSHLM